MDFRSKRVWLGILAGVTVSVICGWLKYTCGSLLLGPVVGAYVGKVSSPKPAAVMGAIVILPLSVMYMIQIQQEILYGWDHFRVTLIIELILLPLLFAAMGALAGAAVGLAFRAMKGKQLMF